MADRPAADQPDVAVHPPTVFLCGLVIGFLLRVFLGGALPLPEALAEGIGGAMMLTALAAAVSSISAFAEAGETLRPASPSRSLLTGGFYRYSRNPIYLAMVLFGAGFGLATLNIWIIATSVITGLIFHFLVIPQEEDYLARRFGDEFALYRQRTRRWL